MSETKKLEVSPSISIIIAGIIIAGAIIFVGKFPAQAQPGEVAQLPTAQADILAPSSDDHVIGSLTAPVVLVEYSDFQCPFCQRVHPTLKRLVAESNGQVAWVYRHFPLDMIHPEARPAALASECVAEQLGNDGFWKFADAVFEEQSNLSASTYSAIATRLGANSAQFAACVQSEKYGPKIDAQTADAEKSGGTGTPYTVVYSKDKQVPVSGALPYEQFKAVIESVQ